MGTAGDTQLCLPTEFELKRYTMTLKILFLFETRWLYFIIGLNQIHSMMCHVAKCQIVNFLFQLV